MDKPHVDRIGQKSIHRYQQRQTSKPEGLGALVPMSVLFSFLLSQMCGCDPKTRNQGALPQMSRSLPNGLHAARNDLASCLTIRSPLEE